MLFSLTKHPGPYGKTDLEILRQEGAADLITDVPHDIPGAIAALASNITVSQGSTGGDQSVFTGKPALFVDPAGSAFGRHLGTLLGLIPVVNSTSEAIAVVV